MKTKARNNIIAASLSCIALSSALFLTTVQSPAKAEAVNEDMQTNLIACEQALSTIDKDVISLVDGYNDVYKNAEWSANKIEYSSHVFLVEDNKYGMYLDFDADNGYAIITTDRKIYSLATSGDLYYLRDEKDIYFSYFDGFMFVDSNKLLQKYEQDTEIQSNENDGAQAKKSETNFTINYLVTAENSATSICNAPSANDLTVYPGQSKPGDGEIKVSEINNYVSARYPGYTFSAKDNSMASQFEYSHQFATSYYIQAYDDSTISSLSEGNCSLNAMYNIMRDWSKRGLIRLPHSETEDISKSIIYDGLYATYGKGTNRGKDSSGSYGWVANDDFFLLNMPILYSNIRSYALNNGYSPINGYSSSKVPATMEYVANSLYNNNLGVEHTTNISTVTTKIWTNRCCYLSINGSSTYGNHGVAVIGYHKYSKEIPINASYTIIEYKYFYEIADGWNYTSQIFDPNTSADAKLNFYYLARC